MVFNQHHGRNQDHSVLMIVKRNGQFEMNLGLLWFLLCQVSLKNICLFKLALGWHLQVCFSIKLTGLVSAGIKVILTNACLSVSDFCHSIFAQSWVFFNLPLLHFLESFVSILHFRVSIDNKWPYSWATLLFVAFNSILFCQQEFLWYTNYSSTDLKASKVSVMTNNSG